MNLYQQSNPQPYRQAGEPTPPQGYNDVQRRYFRAVGAGAFSICLVYLLTLHWLSVLIPFRFSAALGYGAMGVAAIPWMWSASFIGGVLAIVAGAAASRLRDVRNPREALFAGIGLGLGIGLAAASVFGLLTLIVF